MRTPALVFSCLLLALGCASTHADTPPTTGEPVVTVLHGTTRTTPLAPIASPLEQCLLDGGELLEVGAVDNDDTREHGDVVTFAVDTDRRMAVASMDGTVKLWTLEGFLGELNPGVFGYGVEVQRAVVSDLTFFEHSIVAGDVAGLVSMWGEDLAPQVVGGTDPDIGIHAVAVEPSARLLAQADARGQVIVRGLDGAEQHGPLATELTDVRDLAYLDGRLLLAGSGDGPTVELRGETVEDTVARWTLDGHDGALIELATADGLVAAIAGSAVALLDADLSPRWIAEGGDHAPVSLALSTDARFVFTVGSEGSLYARGTDDGEARSRVDVPDPVAVRFDPAGGVVVVASRDGMLRAFACGG